MRKSTEIKMRSKKKKLRDKFRITEKKFCRFCKGEGVDFDYKEIKRMERFLSERGKILSRRITGNCAKHQRKIAVLIKRARFLALLPYVK